MSGTSLPYPATFTSGLPKPRSRWRLLMIIAGCSTAALFYLTSDSGMPFQPRMPLPPLQDDAERQVEWRPDLAFDVHQGRPIPLDDVGDLPDRRPDVLGPGEAEDDKRLPPHVPIRYDPDLAPAYKYGWDDFPPSDRDPWPKRPEIAQIYFAPDHEVKDPPTPEWPAHSALKEAMLNYPYPILTKDDMIQFKDLPPVTPRNGYRPDRTGEMGTPKPMERVQASSVDESAEEKAERGRRRQWVERAIRHGWENYKEWAWGFDEVMPISNASKNPFSGWGATLVDILDLLLLLGWDHEYDLARTHVRAIDFTIAFHDTWEPGQYAKRAVPTFETCIRYLGGFLSAYELSGDEILVERAKELADWLTGAFSSKWGLPAGHYDFGAFLDGAEVGQLVLAEAGTMTLEFARLAQITGERKYFDIVQRVTDYFDTHYDKIRHPKGLFPLHVYDSDDGGDELHGTYSFGGMGDSYYEYLIKTHQLLGGGAPQYGRMYSEAMSSANEVLAQEVNTVPGQVLLTLGEYSWGKQIPTCDHLTCFAGAMIGLGSKLLERTSDMKLAEDFTETCVWAYNMTHSGVAPESMAFWRDSERGRTHKPVIVNPTEGELYVVPRGTYTTGVKRMNTEYKGRPETIESVFYMWRITGDRKWQDKGWSMFHSFVEAAAVDGGFAAISNVASRNRWPIDSCESFVFAETLKYYWLLFSDNDILSLDDWVFSTEAHAFRLPHNQRPASAEPYKENLEIEHRYQDPHDRKAGTRPVGHGTALQQRARIAIARKAVKDQEEREARRQKQLEAQLKAQIQGDDDEELDPFVAARLDADENGGHWIPVGMGGGAHH